VIRPQPATPGPDQESVWDYPRPPRIAGDGRRVRVVCNGRTVVDTTDAVRVLETSHPPGWYIPVAALRGAELRPTRHSTWCEFKGRASYYDIVGDAGVLAVNAAWSYPRPSEGYEALADHFSVYPDRVDRCLVDDQQVRSQAGGFYGGWITDDVVGPFKGEYGTIGW
jgi:uncharacterized protein (DUF427 family)